VQRDDRGPIRLGVVGLSRAFALMLPTFDDPRVQLVAAADPRADARLRFVDDFGGKTYATAAELCDDADVEAVYIASPHQHHAEHAITAARGGKHVLVEKPMALTLEDCSRMIATAREHDVALLVGHSHSFDAPYRRARALIASNAYGRVRMITALNFTDFLYRPRRPEELATAEGGGIIFNQAAHQVDVVRWLGGGRVKRVRAYTGAWDCARPTEGAYSALLAFEDETFASLTYGGYGHFDSDELMNGIGELGGRRDWADYGKARAALRAVHSADDESALKASRAYGGTPREGEARPHAERPAGHNHFGFVIASCEHADLRPMPTGVIIYADDRVFLDPLSLPTIPRVEVMDELYGAVRTGRAPAHSGEWAMATLEVCAAMLESSRRGEEIMLRHQVAVQDC
jgi:phthalate 4,5-cis-dihydrodiol dehydrogenase